MTRLAILTAVTLLAPIPIAGQAPSTGQTFTLAANLMRMHRSYQRDLLASADKMPEGEYGFRPTPDVRPFGELVAHTALTQFASCAVLAGEPNPKAGEKEDAARTKAEHLALLKASSDYCDNLFGAATDEWLHELMTVKGNQHVARGIMLAGSNVHASEMHGTMSVYLRLKGIVPATTERWEKRTRTKP